MRIVNMRAAKTHLSSLVEDVQKGGEIIIAKAGEPVARLVPIGPAKGRRPLGLLRGKIWEAPEAWCSDPELEQLFYDGDPNFPSNLDDAGSSDSPVKFGG